MLVPYKKGNFLFEEAKRYIYVINKPPFEAHGVAKRD